MSVLEFISGKPAKWFLTIGFSNKTLGVKCIQDEIFEPMIDENVLDYIKFNRTITKQVTKIFNENPEIIKKYKMEYTDKQMEKKKERNELAGSIIEKQRERNEEKKQKTKSEKEKFYETLGEMKKEELIKIIYENLGKANTCYLADLAFELKFKDEEN